MAKTMHFLTKQRTMNVNFVAIIGSIVSTALPETIARVRVLQQSWRQGNIIGEVSAGSYEWQFQWHFRQGKLRVTPPLGRALIFEPLGRFLERCDYQLEPGGDYEFMLRSQL